MMCAAKLRSTESCLQLTSQMTRVKYHIERNLECVELMNTLVFY